MVAHVQRTATSAARSATGSASAAASTGSRASRSRRPAASRPTDIEYQAVLGRGWLSPWIEGGKFCGSRGMALPLLGLQGAAEGRGAEDARVQLLRDVRRRHAVGPVPAGETCEAESLAALEAFQVVIRPRGRAASRRPRTPAAATRRRRLRPRTAQPAPAPAKPAPAAAPAPDTTPRTPSRARRAWQRAADAANCRDRAHAGRDRGVKYLFVHQNFPGQYLHFVRHLLACRRNDVVFITEPNANVIPGVRRVPYAKPTAAAAEAHVAARDLDAAVRRAEVVAGMAAQPASSSASRPTSSSAITAGANCSTSATSGPTRRCSAISNSTTAPTASMSVSIRNSRSTTTDFPRIRAKNAVNLLALKLDAARADADALAALRLSGLGAADASRCCRRARISMSASPIPQVRRRNLTIGELRRHAEREAGHLCGARPGAVSRLSRDDARAAAPAARAPGRAGGDGGRRRRQLRRAARRRHLAGEVAGELARQVRRRAVCCCPGSCRTTTYLQMLQRSDAHVYLTYPFVASWSLREALAMGLRVVGSDVDAGARVRHARPQRAADAVPRPEGLAAHGAAACSRTSKLNQRLRTGARRYAERHLDMHACLAGMTATIRELTGA